jgi:ferric-dicitrate binding protein FerR (iron transport regulator)
LDLLANKKVEVKESDLLFPPAQSLTEEEVRPLLEWRQGLIELKDEPLTAVLSQLSPYYGIDFDVQDLSTEQLSFLGTARLGDLPAFLNNLEGATCLHATPIDQRSGRPTIHLTCVIGSCIGH